MRKKLEARVRDIEVELHKTFDPWSSNTIADDVKELDARGRRLEDKLRETDKKLANEFYEGIANTERRLTKSQDDLATRVKVLEQIIRESGLITDFAPEEVKVREDASRDMFGMTYGRHNVAYKINKVKTV
jgi:ribosome-binding protein aMBF1 (putative translation factor)